MPASVLLALGLSCAGRPVALPVPADPAPPRAELLYFVLVDRFANGDPGNDQASPGPAPDLADPQAWHGGDLRGVHDQLDHIEALGVTRVWLSPVFGTRTAPIGEWGAFHGYWQWDPTRVEARFGTEAELLGLARELRARGMGLMLDLVSNHVGYEAPLLAEHPDWFHDAGSIQDWTDPRQLEDGQVHGLPDLDQDRPEVAAWLQGIARQWQETLPLAGYRVDAVRHVPNRFLAELGGAVRARDPAAWWLGEDFTGDPTELAASQRSGGFSHVFDFPLHYAMTEVFCDDAAPARLASVLWQDRLYDSPEGLVTFLDNHDLPRIHSRCHEDPARVRRALIFQFLSRGVPALTYGTEAGLAGAEEPDNRGDMRFDVDLYGAEIRQLMDLRSRWPALVGGQQRVVQLGPDSMALHRVAGGGTLLIGLNRGPTPLSLATPAGLQARLELGQDADGRLSIGQAGPTVVPPHSLRAWLFEGEAALAPETEIEVSVQVQDPALAAGGRPILVGAGPLLGNWDPAAGVPLRGGGGTSAQGSLRAPMGAVLEGKVVIIGADGVARWPEGENQAFLVDGGTWQIGG